jgi:hypothetical protein
MGASCCGHGDPHPAPDHQDRAYRRVLWIALGINAGMFALEIGMGLRAGSASLQADALDFLGDAWMRRTCRLETAAWNPVAWCPDGLVPQSNAKSSPIVYGRLATSWRKITADRLTL